MRLECFYSVVCWRLLNTCNIQVSGIQFNCLLSLLLPGVKPWTHISHFAVEDNHWLLWGQDFTYVFPPWKANIKKCYLAEEFVCPDFMDTLFYLYQMVCLYIGISDIAVSIQHFWHCLCVIILNCKRQVSRRQGKIFASNIYGFEILASCPCSLPSIQLWPQLHYKLSLRRRVFYTSSASNKPNVVLNRLIDS